MRFFYALFLVIAVGTRAEAAPTVWYSPLDDRPRTVNGTRSATEHEHPDFKALITSTAGWQAAASHSSALLFAPFFMSTAPDAELAQIAAFATAHKLGIWVALQAAVMTAPCGQRTEGLIHDARQTTGLIQRLRKLGFPAAGFAFDEPFNNAVSQVDRPGNPACHLTAAQAAQSLVTVTNEIKTLYPDARIMDIENPLFRMTAAEAVVTVPRWLEAYQQATGVKLDGLALDTYFDAPGWAESVSGIAGYLHAHNQRLMLYALSPNYGPGRTTDESWLANTKLNVDAMQRLRVKIDVVIVESWMGHPANNLPETGEGLTSIVDYVTQTMH
jgi:hypothetical protein